MSTLGVIGCILGFLIVIYLCYKDWSVYLATFAGACVVIACNTLPFIDSLVGDYVSGMFTAVKSFFFMILFGCLQSKIYTESGAAYTIADTVMNRLLKENMSNTGKNLIGMSVILVIGTILNLGGIIAGVITNTDAFQSMITAITSISIAPILICWVVVALMCMLTGGSSTGQLVALPIIAPKLQALGLTASTIHRVSAFAATTLDSMPYSGSILMLLPMCHMKLKEVYPALFVTTVIATTVGTAAVTLMCVLFPGLA